MQETGIRFLGREDPLEQGMATHSSILAWRIPWTKDSSRLQVHWVAKSRTHLSDLYTWDRWCRIYQWENWGWEMCMFSQGHKNKKRKQCFDVSVSVPKDHLLSRGKRPLVCELTMVFSTRVLYVLSRKLLWREQLQCWKDFPISCWKLFIGCLFLYAFFFLFHSFSLEPLGIFLFTLDHFRWYFFLLFLGQALLF